MILRNATIKYKGYDPNSLTKGSHKRICVSCDDCGRIRWVAKFAYRDLCLFCSHPKGKITSNETKIKMHEASIGKSKSEEHKRNIGLSTIGRKHTQFQKDKWSKDRSDEGNSNYGKFGKDSAGWKGGFDINRPWVLSENQCIKLNSKFKESHFHHITKSLGIYIPGELHNHIKHNIKTGKNMGEINMLAIQFINGGLNV